MTELIVIPAGFVIIAGVLLAKKVPRTIIKQVLKDPFHTTQFEVKSNGDGTKDIKIKRQNGDTHTVQV